MRRIMLYIKCAHIIHGWRQGYCKSMQRPVHQLHNCEPCRPYYLHRKECTGRNSRIVHLQQGKVVVVSFTCVDENIHCTPPKPSVPVTNIMWIIMAYITCTHLLQGWTQGCCKPQQRPVHQLYSYETCRPYYQHCIGCTGRSSRIVHLQQGKVLVVSNLCVGKIFSVLRQNHS